MTQHEPAQRHATQPPAQHTSTRQNGLTTTTELPDRTVLPIMAIVLILVSVIAGLVWTAHQPPSAQAQLLAKQKTLTIIGDQLADRISHLVSPACTTACRAPETAQLLHAVQQTISRTWTGTSSPEGGISADNPPTGAGTRSPGSKAGTGSTSIDATLSARLAGVRYGLNRLPQTKSRLDSVQIALAADGICHVITLNTPPHARPLSQTNPVDGGDGITIGTGATCLTDGTNPLVKKQDR